MKICRIPYTYRMRVRNLFYMLKGGFNEKFAQMVYLDDNIERVRNLFYMLKGGFNEKFAQMVYLDDNIEKVIYN